MADASLVITVSGDGVNVEQHGGPIGFDDLMVAMCQAAAGIALSAENTALQMRQLPGYGERILETARQLHIDEVGSMIESDLAWRTPEEGG